MSLETEVANLTTQTTALLNAVNVSKATLDQKATVATEQAAIATTKAGESSASASTATTKAAEAAASAALADIEGHATSALESKNAALAAKMGAEAARDASAVAGKVYSSTAEGIASGFEYFSVPSAASSEFLILYQNDAGVARDKGRYPSAKVLEQFASYTGVGPIYPIATDKNNRVVLGFDVGSDSLVGQGLVAKETIPAEVNKYLGDRDELNYMGTGPIWPIVLANDNKVLLGFDEGANRLVGPGIGDSLIPIDMPVAKAINHILFYGQSLSVGAQGTPILSTSQPYNNITFNGGPRAWTGSANDFTAFKPLVEDAVSPAPDGTSGRGETPCSGAANFASTLAAVENGVTDHVILASTAGHGGYRIDQLDKASAWYSKLLAHVSAAKALNSDYALHAIAWMQGENDSVTGVQTPYSTYRAKLEQFQADAEEDAIAISGQKSPVFLITYQLSCSVRTWPDQAKAQLDLAQKNPKFILATPTYHLPHAGDNVHLTAAGYKWIGAYFGRAYKQLVLDGKKMQWLNPVSATRRGAVIRVRFDVPTLPLVLDTETLATTTDKGFRVLDGDATAAISTISVDGTDLVITLTTTPSGVVKVRAGLDYIGSGLSITGGSSTNLRDSTPEIYTVNGIARPLYHVCPHFELTATLLGE